MVLKYESEKILAKALMIMFISTVILLVNAFFHPNFLIFELSIFTSIAMLGFIAPNTTTLAMARFKEHGRTASAVLGTMQFGFAGFISFAVGVINTNAPIIFVFVNVYLRIGCKYDIFSNQNKGEKMKTNNIFMALAIVLASLILAFGFNKALSDFKTLERSVSVKGLSQKEVEADTLILPIKFTRSNNNLTNLYEELEQDKENIIKFLKEQGVKEDEINYNSPNIIDRLSDPYSNDTQAAYRYIGTANLLIYTQNVKLGKSILEKISSLAKFGIVTKIDDYDIEYLYTKLNEIKPQMIEEATLNARNSAIKFAQDSNSYLGKIKKASQGQFSISNRDKNTPYIKTIRVVSTIEYYLKD
ncbi:PUTATIVE PERIPLASMIC PROTEIN [Campylobacter jejuni subsp. doylei]|nr:PUTATIVE PERIPLASMIC PROTEIN [Campylobacter jejuni subsp. doylei]